MSVESGRESFQWNGLTFAFKLYGEDFESQSTREALGGYWSPNADEAESWRVVHRADGTWEASLWLFHDDFVDGDEDCSHAAESPTAALDGAKRKLEIRMGEKRDAFEEDLAHLIHENFGWFFDSEWLNMVPDDWEHKALFEKYRPAE